MNHFARDVAQAWRRLLHAPVFSAVVVITLALGIGANSAVLGVIDTMYFRKLPVPSPDRVVAIYSSNKHDLPSRPGRPLPGGGYSTLADYLKLRSTVTGVTGLAAYSMAGVEADAPLADTYSWTAFVSGNYFDVLDVKAQVGRTIRPDEEEAGGAHPVVVISDFIWREKFGADRGVIGRDITIAKKRFTIVGVAPAGFTGVHPEGRTNLWIPFTMKGLATGDTSSFAARTGGPSQIIGRLSPGVALADFQATVSRAERNLRETYPAADSLLALRAAIRDRLTTPELSANGLIWIATVWVMIALLHLAACTNVASLMLARADARRRELGVRLCLGASRSRILIESLTEAGLLALAGGGAGLLVGRFLSVSLASMQFLSTSDPGLDLRVVALVGVVTLGTVLQFGLLPALDASRTDPLALLRGTQSARRAGRLDRAGMVIVAQVAISLTLLGNASAFMELFAHQSFADPGYDVRHLLIARVSSRPGCLKSSSCGAAVDEAIAAAQRLPGVQSVAVSSGAPLVNLTWYQEIVVPGRATSAEAPIRASLLGVGPGYFSTIGSAVIRGREFSTRDRLPPGTKRENFDVVIVNEAMANLYWSGENALGKTLAIKGSPPATVVGIARDIHDVSTVAFVPRAYFPFFEREFSDFDLVVRVAGDVTPALSRLRAALQPISPDKHPTVQSMMDVRGDALLLARTAGVGLLLCAAIALLLAAIGLYGIVSMWVARRRGEIGIRLALGSPSRDVHRLLLTEAAKLTGVGGTVGMVCALGLVQVERGRLGPYLALDALPIIGSILVLAIIAGTAAFIPSWRASRRSPADVLRSS